MDKKKFLLEAEKRFKKFAKLTQDISIFPLPKDIVNIETNKEKSKEFSEVFTPLWLVDEMISQVKFSGADIRTLDLCAGYGQFSIRLMRYFYEKYPDWDVEKFKNNHAFSELQLSSCYKLLITFGNKITLFIGDSIHLNKLPPKAKGVWCYIESYGYWVCLTKTISTILSPNGIKKKACSEAEFVLSVEIIIKNLNKVYSIMNNIITKQPIRITLEQLMSSPKTRLHLIKEINNLVKDDKGQTIVKMIPSNLVSDMLDQIDDLEKKTILVLFNCEVVDYLITKKKIDPKQITFGVDLKGALKSDMMKKMYNVDTITLGSENETEFLHTLHNSFKGRKFDVCLSNPPYNSGLDLKILQALLGDATTTNSIAKEFVFVHPSTWLLDQKNKKPLYFNLKNLLARKLKSVKFFNGNATFGVELFVPCAITHIDCGYDDTKTDVEFFDEKFVVASIADITKFGVAWQLIVKPFMTKIEKQVLVRGNVWSHITKIINPAKSYAQVAAVRGDVKDRGQKKVSDHITKEIVKDNFYTMLIDVESCKGLRDRDIAKKTGGAKPTFGFESVLERDNFLHYLNTDFARFCLALTKINVHLDRGEMELIPWLDFTQSWDDEKLFKHFDINKETQDYIRKFLPDYYRIRK